MKNGASKAVKLVLAMVVTLAFVFVGIDIIKVLIGLGKFEGALSVIMLYMSTLGYIAKDFLTSGRETTQVDAPAGCKQKVVAEVTCD